MVNIAGVAKKIPSRAVSLVLFALIVLFFVLYLRSVDFSKLAHLSISWSYLLLASLISLVFRYWGAFIWRTILSALGATGLPNFTVLTHIYARAWMGRYIPGTVTWIAGKIYLANKVGISKSRLAVSSLLEGGMQIIALMAVSMLLLGFDPRLDVIPVGVKVLMVVLGVVLLLFLSPPIFNRLLHVAHMLIKKEAPGEELRINGKAVIRSFLLYAVGAFIAGLSYFFLSRALAQHTSWKDFLFIVGVFNLAGALGMVAVFAPSGLGVRDGIQLVLLSLIFPKEIALAITVFSRLWSAVIDVLFYLFAEGAYRLKKSEQP
ncbi:MAG TPA: lysylphosphatidylglycerol synthase domain-containing protein [Candidatus Babeliaceae bacterium]|nr:lysylphosphatidylglycerol synthase domain-containing protein [Candidatus Babeliaceae bacterium]